MAKHNPVKLSASDLNALCAHHKVPAEHDCILISADGDVIWGSGESLPDAVADARHWLLFADVDASVVDVIIEELVKVQR